MSATRLGLLIGFGAALALLAWRLVEELREETRRRADTVWPTPGYLVGQDRPVILPEEPRPTRPKPDIGPDRPDPRDRSGSSAWDAALIVLLVAGVVAIGIVLALGLVPR